MALDQNPNVGAHDFGHCDSGSRLGLVECFVEYSGKGTQSHLFTEKRKQ